MTNEFELWDKRFQEYLYEKRYFIEFLEEVDSSKIFIIICDIDIDCIDINSLRKARNFWYNTHSKLEKSIFNLRNTQRFVFNTLIVVKEKEIVLQNKISMTLNRYESFVYQPFSFFPFKHCLYGED